MAHLEHVNFTAPDPDRTAARLCALFDWQIRWTGQAKTTGYTVHVGGTDTYLAIYAQPGAQADPGDTYATRGGLNHIGVVVDDIDATEARVADLGYTPHMHGDYEPGRRFYFDMEDGIEIEVVSYA